MTRQIGPYEVLHLIGEGAMGAVYAAHDERLERTVALKLMTASAEDSKERFWREAKIAAKVNHPNICQIYDVGEHDDQPYLAMELLDGEPLEARIEQGPIALPKALEIVRQILEGLEALHARGVVHRDLKPSNVFLAESGVKLLDFGLARPLRDMDADLTQPGLILGTPRYMAPEQWGAQTAVPATDLFAVAAILFELLTSQPAFDGDSPVELMRAITSEHPPALTGDSTIEAVDRVMHRALAKSADERYGSAAAMIAALDSCKASGERTLEMPSQVRAVTRLLIFPFKLLRPDEEIDFLSFALADAVTASLSGMHSLVVRSALAGARYDAGGSPDLEAIAADKEVDALLFGTLLRSGERVRLVTQLLQLPGGTVLSSSTEEARLDDVFRLQDELAEKVIRSLAVPLGERKERLQRLDVPASGEAYEQYLRANDIATQAISGSVLRTARQLYKNCLELDPSFAPAWARLGRVERVLAKYGEGRADAAEHRLQAELAFEQALRINPDLPIAHNLLTYLQVEEQGDAMGAMVRLLEQVVRLPDPDLYAGLVVACRFCGLLDASLAAHQQARRLDPHIPTSVSYTYWMLGDDERSAESEQQAVPFMRLYSMVRMGRIESAGDIWAAIERRDDIGTEKAIIRAHWAAARGMVGECLAAAREVLESPFNDPEGLFFVALSLALVGQTEPALDVFEDIVARGFCCLHLIRSEPSLASVEGEARFAELTRRSEAGSEEAHSRFVAGGGERLLGITLP